jgi:CAAX prenyl protease-like protein
MPEQQTTAARDFEAAAYTVPMLAFLTFTYLEGKYPSVYPALYTTKVVVTAVLLVVFRRNWSDLRSGAELLPLSLGAGIVGLAAWVLIERGVPYPHLGDRSAYNPLQALPTAAAAWSFLAVRFLGLALLVPVMEELFWRSFLIRWLTRADWKSVRPYEFSLQGMLLMCGGFALAHPEWLSAAVYALLMAWLLRRTRSVWACAVAHGVTNFGLGLYVLLSGDWRLW